MARTDSGGWWFLEQMHRDLRESIQIGAALAGVVAIAGCGGRTEGAPVDAPNAGSGGSAGHIQTAALSDLDAGPVSDAGSAPVPAPGPRPVPALESLPAEQLGCVGPTHDDGYHGQCCFTQRCYVPAPGAACSEDYWGRELLNVVPPGSGTCSCGPGGREPVSGPFAPNLSVPASLPEADVASPPEGSCCYVVGSIGCTGRPFVVNEAQRVADCAWRDDWGLFA
jgi:hypothetical protein